MDFSYYKYLKFINKQPKVSYHNLADKYNLDKQDARNILITLAKNEYLAHIGDTYFKSTFKGKHFIKSLVAEWLFKNLLAIIDLIIAILGVVIAFMALFK